MSRLAKNPIPVPEGVSVTLDGQTVKAKGKAERSYTIHKGIKVEMNDNVVQLSIPQDDPTKQLKAQWGTDHALIRSLFEGLSKGFEKKMILNGVGYRANVQGSKLVMALGFSHDVEYTIPEGVTIAVEKQVNLTVSGTDKQKVGQVCAEIRKWRPPEPYKGKGIRFEGEHIRRKEGKKK